MSDTALYVAGLGVITAIGANTAMTAAALRAGVSGYRASRFFTQGTRQPITMAQIPSEILELPDFDFDEGSYDNLRIIMARLALREALGDRTIQRPIPLLLTVPEPEEPASDHKRFIAALCQQKDLPLAANGVRYLASGRAAGIEGLALAQHLLTQQKAEFVLIGGSDSYAKLARLRQLEEGGRLLTPVNRDGFAPGEGAGFVLLTTDPARAKARDGYAVVLCQPASGEEVGHLHSAEPYRAEGLDRVFKQVLQGYAGDRIETIYASLNGEHYFAKEYGVAFVRNSMHFHDQVKLQHPADCLGDLGAATGAILLALAAADLWKRRGVGASLVYSASDGPMRAAVLVKKVSTTEIR